MAYSFIRNVLLEGKKDKLFHLPLPYELTELAPVKIHCSILAEDAIKAAVNDYRNRHST